MVSRSFAVWIHWSISRWLVNPYVCQSLDKWLIHWLVLVSQCTLVSLLAVGPLVGWSVPPLVSWFVASLFSPSVSALSLGWPVSWLASLFYWCLNGPLLIVFWSLTLHVAQVCCSIGQSLGQFSIFLIGPSIGESVVC